MAQEQLNQLIAENTEEAAHQSTHSEQSPSADNVSGGAELELVEDQSIDEPSVFSQILSENLGDHSQIGFYHVFHFDLPKIIYDDGLHFYSNTESMNESGQFTVSHHHIVRTEDHQPVALDLSVTSLVVFEWIAMLVLLVGFGLVGRKYKKNPTKAPHGFQNMIESVFVYVRDEIVRPNVGGERLAKSLLPYFIVLFFFILVMNLTGLVPGGHSATGNLAVTAALAVTAFLVINGTAIKEIGVGNWLKHLLGGAPWWLAFIMIPIEILSMFTKPFALTVRLFANMTAGHVVLLCLVGLIFFFQSLAISPISVGFSLFIYALEILVGFIQAYIFTILTAVFVGLAIGDHGHEEHHEETTTLV
ncbi:MAG: F0F1 ATP synthase subunit A [Candidatus Kapaibacterium sp.]